MAPLPFLTDGAVRLAAGMAAMLLVTPWGVVPPGFFRTHCLVILGLLVVSALFLGTTHGLAFGLLAGGAGLSYVASIGWGLGARRIGAAATLGILLAAGGLLAASSPGGRPGEILARGSSAFLLGATLSAMLLGHHYLTAPAMGIDPLKRFVAGMILALGLRILTARPGLAQLLEASSGAWTGDPLYVGMRWGIGVLGTGLAASLTWRTVAIRSTQSATGILYIAMTFVLIGELTDMRLARDPVPAPRAADRVPTRPSLAGLGPSPWN